LHVLQRANTDFAGRTVDGKESTCKLRQRRVLIDKSVQHLYLRITNLGDFGASALICKLPAVVAAR